MSRPLRLADLPLALRRQMRAALKNAPLMGPMPQPVPKPERVVDDAYRAWIGTHPCAICCLTPGRPVPSGSECAHVGGKRRHGDRENCVPLCHWHHIGELHTMGIGSFSRKYKVNLRRMAGTYWRAYLREGLEFAF